MINTFVSHLECSISSKHYEAGKIHGLSDEGRSLLVRYDLEKMAAYLNKEDIGNSGSQRI